MKICTKCKESKELDQFNKRSNTKDGYNSSCSLCSREYDSNYRNENKDKIDLISLNYRTNNRDKKSTSTKNWIINNPEKHRSNVKIFRDNNPDYGKNYISKRKKEDPLFALNMKIRSSLQRYFKRFIEGEYMIKYKTKEKVEEILGCTFEEFKIYIESKFESWMNWNNHGNPKDGILEYNKTWDIDHIIPLKNAKTEEDFIKLNHYTNLQPLCSVVNRKDKHSRNIK